MTWFKVINCVNTELFPVLSIALKKCIDEKLSDDNQFKIDDFGSDAIDDVMERLKEKRAMNNKEIKCLNGLFQRAIALPQQRLVSALCKTQCNLSSHAFYQYFLSRSRIKT